LNYSAIKKQRLALLHVDVSDLLHFKNFKFLAKNRTKYSVSTRVASPSLTLPYDDDLHRHSNTNVHSSSLWPHLFRPSQSSTIFHRYPAIGSKSLSSMNKSFHFYRQALRLHISRFVRRLPETHFSPLAISGISCLIPDTIDHYTFCKQRSASMTTARFSHFRKVLYTNQICRLVLMGQTTLRSTLLCLFYDMSRLQEEHILDCGQHAVSFYLSEKALLANLTLL